MTTTYNFYPYSKIRLYKLYSLIFFAFIFLTACEQNKQQDISLVWNNNQAIAITVPSRILKDYAPRSANALFQVRLQESVDAMLGDVTTEEDHLVFTPVVPLTRGLVYEILWDNQIIDKITVPTADASRAPRLIAVYPSLDTLPENLLKLYVQFSHPMREGEALKHIALLDQQQDTVKGVFLDLQPELWNKERTVLTLWLDPGRIKRELIPNQQLGNPLLQGRYYTLAISTNWKDVQDLPLQQAYQKKFIVTLRDSVSPNVEKWQIKVPKAESGEPLEIILGEPLDYFLLKEAIQIVDENQVNVAGELAVGDRERKLVFRPRAPWQPGKYTLRARSILEDLAGNNLNRAFDRDITAKNVNTTEAVAVRMFEIRK